MGRILAKELQKYYRRTGNRVVFKNGASLNQLAWEMWENLNFREIEPGTLSRVLSGERKFTIRQLEIFSQILRLGNKQYAELKNALKRELLAKHGLEMITTDTREETMNHMKLVFENIKLAISNGDPITARGLGEELLDFIEILLMQRLTPNKRNELYKLKAQVAIEIVDALFGTIQEKSLYLSAIPYVDEVKRLGKLLKEENIYKNAYTLMASLLSLCGKHQMTFAAANQGLSEGDMGEFQTATGLKSALVSASAMDDRQNIQGYAKAMRQSMPRFSDNFRVMGYYSLAYGEAKLGHLKLADKYLGQGWVTYKSLGNMPNAFMAPRKLSLANSEMHIALNNPGFRDKNYLRKLGEDSIELATITGFYRIRQKFERYMEMMS